MLRIISFFNAMPNTPFWHLKTGAKARWYCLSPSIFVMMALLLLLSLRTEAQTEPEHDTEGLVAHYDFNKSWIDSKADFHAEAHRMWRGRDAFTYARRGSALFQAKDNHLLLPININSDSLTQLTFTAWINPTEIVQVGTQTMTVFSNMRQGAGQALRIVFDQGTGKPGLVTMTGEDQSDHFHIELDGWTFVAISINHATRRITLYANGQKRTITGSPKTGMGIVYLGYCLNYPSLRFHGLMDDVRFYNKLLSDNEIQAISDQRQPDHDQFDKNKKVFASRKSALQAKPNWALEGETLATIHRNDAIKPNRILGIKKGGKTYDELPFPQFFADGRQMPGKGLFRSGLYSHRVVEFEVDARRLAYVDMHDVIFFQAEHPTILKYWRMFFNYASFLNLIITFVSLVLLYYGLLYFSVFDKVVVDRSKSFADPGVAWPAMIFMGTGFITGVMNRYFEPSVYHFTTSPLLWPAGHAAEIWVLWSLMVLMALTVIVSLVESMIRAGWLFGLPRFLILMIFSAATFLTYSFAVAQSFWIGVIVLLMLVRFKSEFEKASNKTGITGQWIYVDG